MESAKRVEAVVAMLEPEGPASTEVIAPRAEEVAVERLLSRVSEPVEAPELSPAAAQALAAPGLRLGRVVSMSEDGVMVRFRARGAPVLVDLDEGVDEALVARAMQNGDSVLVEVDPVEGPLVVGVVQRRLPEEVEITGKKVIIDAEDEVLLRTGKGAMRINPDGEVEIVGSRIHTVSRGLFRIVGRVLRLN